MEKMCKPTTKELDERHLHEHTLILPPWFDLMIERGPRYSTVYGYDLENGWVWAQDTEGELQELLREMERGEGAVPSKSSNCENKLGKDEKNLVEA